MLKPGCKCWTQVPIAGTGKALISVIAYDQSLAVTTRRSTVWGSPGCQGQAHLCSRCRLVLHPKPNETASVPSLQYETGEHTSPPASRLRRACHRRVALLPSPRRCCQDGRTFAILAREWSGRSVHIRTPSPGFDRGRMFVIGSEANAKQRLIHASWSSSVFTVVLDISAFRRLCTTGHLTPCDSPGCCEGISGSTASPISREE